MILSHFNIQLGTTTMYYEIEIEQDAFCYMIRDEIFKRFGVPIHCGFFGDGEKEVFRSNLQREAEVAKEITGNDWIIKEYSKTSEEPANYKGFTWGT